MSEVIVARRYRLAGLDLVSDFALPEAGAADVAVAASPLVIEDGRRRGTPRPAGGNARSADAMRVRVVQPGVGCVVVEDGLRAAVWTDPDVSDEALSQLLTGSIVAIALMQRGVLVLHGCVVGIGGHAVAVLGHCGDGKSTTAAACAARGHQVLSDDLVVLDLAGAGVTVRPVAPLVRMLSTAHVDLPGHRQWTAADKTVVGLDAPSADAHMRLTGLVRLRWDDAVSRRPLEGVEAVLGLLEHAYCRPVFQPPQVRTTMAQCTTVAARCPVADLTRPRRLDALDAVVAQLEDVATLSA